MIYDEKHWRLIKKLGSTKYVIRKWGLVSRGAASDLRRRTTLTKIYSRSHENLGLSHKGKGSHW